MAIHENADDANKASNILRLFRKAGKNSRRVLLLALLVASRPSVVSLAAGLPLALLSELFIVLAYGVFTRKGDTRGRLITTGPFAFLRNPVYFGYIMVGVGFTLAAGFQIINLVLGLVYFAVVIPNYLFRIGREEALLYEQFGKEFENYKKRVRRRLLPSLVSGIRNGGFKIEWSFRLALENRSIAKVGKTLLWCMVFIAKWAVLEKWKTSGRYDFWNHPLLYLWLAGVVFSIVVMTVPPLLYREKTGS